MTQITVSAGSAVNVTLPANNRLIIGGSGVYRVGPLGTSQRPTVDQLIDTTTTVGPFEDSCVVRIAATLGATYEVIAPTDALDSRGLPALVSGAGNLNQDKLSQLFGDDEMIIGTYANRPVATSVAPGKEFAASDLGYARWVSDGTQWILLKPGALMTMATPSGITDTAGQATTESTLLTLNLPASALGENDGLLLDLVWSCTNSAAAKRIRARFGGTVLFNLDLTTHLVFRQSVKLRNRNSQSSQVSQGNSSTNFGPVGSVGVQTFTVDFATAQALTITGQFPVTGTGTNTLTLEEATINAI